MPSRDLSTALTASEPLHDFLANEEDGGGNTMVAVNGKMYLIAYTRIAPAQDQPKQLLGTVGEKNLLTLNPPVPDIKYEDPRLVKLYDQLVELLSRTHQGSLMHKGLKSCVKRVRALIDTEEAVHAPPR